MQAMCFLRKAFPHTLMGDVGTRRSGCPRQATHVWHGAQPVSERAMASLRDDGRYCLAPSQVPLAWLFAPEGANRVRLAALSGIGTGS
jgi:hypothetical protein